MSRFSPDTEAILRTGGWMPGRKDLAFVDSCSRALDRPGGFRMHAAARSAIGEFGGLSIGASGTGVDFARSDVVFDPRLALGEEDRLRDSFDELRGRNAYPLGECIGGTAFLAIDELGSIYIVGDVVSLVATSLDAALESLLLGQSSGQR